MITNLYTKKILLVMSFILVGTLTIPQTYAYTLQNREDFHLDEALVDDTNVTYTYPTQILISQEVSPNEKITIDTDKWYKNLYYYYITRLGFTDIPYNYLVDRDGTVYHGRRAGEGATPFLTNQDSAILIAYMSNGSDVTLAAADTLKELVEELSYTYGITTGNVHVVNYTISQPEEESSVSQLDYTYANTAFSNTLNGQINKYEYSRENHLSYTAELSKTEFSFDATAADKVDVSVEVTNTGDTPWYTDHFDIYLETEDGTDSDYAVNGVWDSFTNPMQISQGTVAPGDTITLEFQMQAPLQAGEYEESFIIRVLKGTKFEGSTFTAKFNAVAGDFDLVRIKETVTGKLNVRSGPYVNADKVTDVAVGKIFIQTGYQDGWYKIKYSEEGEGWVYGKYIEDVE